MKPPKTPPDDRNADRESARSVFGARVERYAGMDVFSEERFYRPLLDLAAPQPGERVLDLACGSGVMALLLSRITSDVVGIDVTPEMLEKAKERVADVGAVNVTLLEGEASALPFPDQRFDLVTCRTAFHHFPDPRKALKEVSRVLAPAGRFAMEDVLFTGGDAVRTVRERIERLFDVSHIRSYRISEIGEMLESAGMRLEKVINQETKGMPLEFMLRLQMIEDESRRREISVLLEENVDMDLGGFHITRTESGLQLSWDTFIASARHV